VWENFSSMPSLLKLFTAAAFGGVFLLIASVIPGSPFSINGHATSYSQWWMSGAGPFVLLFGIVGPIIGMLLVIKSRNARGAYLGFLTLGLIMPHLFAGVSVAMAFADAVFLCATAFYLYKWRSAQLYFTLTVRSTRP
jgi:hypothetical protein